MKSKIYIELQANGTLSNVTQGEDKIFQGAVDATEYHLSVKNGITGDYNWRQTDVVYLAMERPDGQTAQVKMTPTGDGWVYTSNGWETDVDISTSAILTISFLNRRYSTVSAGTVASEKTTQEIELTIYESSAFTPRNIEITTAEELEELVTLLQSDKVGRYSVSDTNLPYLPAEINYDIDSKKTPNNIYYDFTHDVYNYAMQEITNVTGALLVTCNSYIDGEITYYRQMETLFANANIFTRNIVFHIVDEAVVVDVLGSFIMTTSDLYMQLKTLIDTNATNITNNANAITELNNTVTLIIPKANGAVRFDITQALTDEQKERARLNIGIAGGNISMLIVSVLPETGLPNTIYLVPNSEPETSNLYTEWIWVNGAWELWGQVSIDLTPYVTYAQGVENSGKTFQVGVDGILTLVDFPTAPIQEIQVNGTEVPPVDGVVDLTIDCKKYATIIVGASDSGVTANEVDYLCTGINDEQTFLNIISQYQNSEIVITLLNGTYHLMNGIDITQYGNKVQFIGENNSLRSNHCVNISLDMATGSYFTISSDVCFKNITFNTTVIQDTARLLNTSTAIYLTIMYDHCTMSSSSSKHYCYLFYSTYNSHQLIINNCILNGYYLKLANKCQVLVFSNNYYTSSTSIFMPPEVYLSTITNNCFGISGSTTLYIDIGTSTSTSGYALIANNIFLAKFTINLYLSNSIISNNKYLQDQYHIINDYGTDNYIQNGISANKLQVEKVPTLPNDVIRETERLALSNRIEEVAQSIPATVNRYFTLTPQTLFLKNFYVMQETKPTGVISNKDTTITATTQETAQELIRFTTTDATTEVLDLPIQSTQITIQAQKTAGTQNILIFARGYVMDNAGNETLLSTSNLSTLTTTLEDYTLFLPIPAYTAPIGSRAVIEIMAYRVAGGGTHTARITVDDDTMSRWSYNLSAGSMTFAASQITYDNITSGLSATKAQGAIDELASEKADKVISPTTNDLAKLDSNGNLADSGVGVTTTAPSVSSDDTTVPTSKAVYTALAGASGLTIGTLASPSTTQALSTSEADTLLQKKDTVIDLSHTLNSGGTGDTEAYTMYTDPNNNDLTDKYFTLIFAGATNTASPVLVSVNRYNSITFKASSNVVVPFIDIQYAASSGIFTGTFASKIGVLKIYTSGTNNESLKILTVGFDGTLDNNNSMPYSHNQVVLRTLIRHDME